MEKPKVKLPQAGGAKKASEIFEKTRKRQPSEELVKIISEVTEKYEEEVKPKIDRVARDSEI